jgi:histidyl-tRNA synthetase
VLFTNFGHNEALYCLPLLKLVRNSGLNAEIFPESAKMKKQMKYADQKGISIVIIAGEEEVATDTVTIKWMKTGEQQTISKDELLEKIAVSQ